MGAKLLVLSHFAKKRLLKKYKRPALPVGNAGLRWGWAASNPRMDSGDSMLSADLYLALNLLLVPTHFGQVYVEHSILHFSRDVVFLYVVG